MLRSCISLLSFTVACGGAPAETDTTAGPDSLPPAQGTTLRVEEVAQGLTRPVELLSPAGDQRIFVVEQPGRIRIMENGRLLHGYSRSGCGEGAGKPDRSQEFPIWR